MTFAAIAAMPSAEGASAGILAPYIEGHVSSLLKLGVRSLALYDDFIQRVTSDAGIEVEYTRCGTLQVAAADAETIRLAALARELSQARVVHRLFDKNEVREIEPDLSPNVHSALLIPSHGYVVADSLMRALVAAAMRYGVVFETTTVTQVGAAAGPTLLNGAHGQMAVGAGMVVSHEQGVDVEPTGNVEGLLAFRAAYYTYDRPKTNLDISFQYYPSVSNFGRQRLQFDTSIRRELLKDFFVSLNVFDTFDSEPPNPDADRNDVGVVISLGWSY